MRRFFNETKASTAMMTAIIFGAMVPAAGGALDYTNAMSKKSEFQKAVDSAALAAIAQLDLTAEQRATFAKDYLNKLPACLNVDCSTVSAVYDGQFLTMSGSINVNTYVLGITGIDTIPVAVGTKAMLGNTSSPVEVVMVLDYSGSMDWGPNAASNKFNSNEGEKRYVTMRKAAKSFIDQIDDRDVDGSKVGVVPFSEFVLTPMKGRYLYDLNTETDLSAYNDVLACVTNRRYPHSISAATPSASNEGQLWPTVSYSTGGAYSGNIGTPKTMYVSTGLLISELLEYVDTDLTNSRTQPNVATTGFLGLTKVVDGHNEFRMRWVASGGLLNLSKPSLVNNLPWTGSGIVATDYSDAGSWTSSDDGLFDAIVQNSLIVEGLGEECQIYADKKMWSVPMTDSFSNLKSKLDDMRPLGATNIALGLDLGFHGLTSNAPFEEGTAEESKKALILLTDGVQTVSAHGPSNMMSVNAANAVIENNCQSIKDAGISVFTIVFGQLDAATTTLMEECASEEAYFYQTNETSEVDGIFDNIFKQATGGKPRIAF